MENPFERVMSERSNEALIKIVTAEREKYQPEALEAAEAEIQKRNIDTSNFEALTQQATVQKERVATVHSDVAGSGLRLLNFVIDTIIWLTLAALFTFPLSANNPMQLLLGYVLVFAAFIGYYYVMETKFQRTVGKFMTKTKVVQMDGTQPSNGTILVRTLSRLLPFDRLSYLFVKNGLHDYLSKTMVVRDRKEWYNRN